ncbi:MAG TPA: 3-methyl-2-oxobutanoate hydroxymethyltransferase [Anaerohalosphaeraceae bacterium]|nr:3-methyl-2-oxobutanoate hydroxymethyltransferase [Phycisphaerae bacterium]HOK95359.1 3-methyl-2-oxobutanoate hydroxymethyltransferase [Anaerohalosphaeraceae bacterium]HOM76447.1 3-methyl-2-oxobutanoate hydroxymethyltransferase [Anaerohalosphaeraceae bacterium]HPC64281.1 3-methyl-2-oxobutanoate hydroxymethyltransferase [Anaerohalosphaeraceae bacterium]HPO69983.1 3-methyl-2-oxobutanoate hydroxymethyltransferase [Anaerohalosphaeraceae bacterium]
MDKKVTISDLMEAKQAGRKITAVSCYDYTTARLVAQAGIEMILVGDSAAQVMLGYETTLPATMDFMVTITAAVRRAAPNVCLAADMPFLSYQTGLADAVRNAGRFFQEAGVQIVKVEAASAHLDVVKAISDSGMAVMAHIGIRPQQIAKLGRLKAEGTTAELAMELVDLSRQMVQAGAGMLLLEGTAREVAKIVAQINPVPVISCGSGPDCDGQILIISDILGLSGQAKPKFAKNFAHLDEPIVQAVAAYAQQVRQMQYPSDEHCYHIKSGQLERLRQMLDEST